MNYRHGDLALVSIERLPEGLTASKSKVLMTGSGGNDHIFTDGTFYPKAYGQTVGYLDAPNGSTLLHPNHGEIVGKGKKLRVAEIEVGVYTCIKQIEQTHDGMRPVED